jgi:hypothetical protein
MSPFNRITAAILCAALSPVAIAAAQEPAAAHASASDASASTPAPHTPVREWTAHEALLPSSSTSQSGGAHGALIGALVGGAAATAIVYSAAKTYGENESGGFCGGCFLTWGSWAIPVGAVGGAAIGYGLAKASAPQVASPVPGTFIAPVIGRRGGGVVMTIRY